MPAGNRNQLRHQVLVTGLDWCLFVTSKIVNEKGCIVQTVRIKFSEGDRDEYRDLIKPRIKNVVGWLHKTRLVEKGYLVDSDFPSWVSEEQRGTIKSRYQLWSAHERIVKEDEQDFDESSTSSDSDTDEDLFGDKKVKYNPFPPIYVIKHGFLMRYNKGKGGLDKNTEVREFLRPSTAMPFEPKYIYVMVACILISLWRVEQSITIAKPFILKYRADNDDDNPSINQLRKALEVVCIGLF